MKGRHSFAEGALGYVEDPGFPQFDPEAGSALLDEIGRPDSLRYGAVNGTDQLLTAELFADMWSANCGLDVDIDQFDQAELVTRALTADFEVMLWRNHGRGSPGLEIQTWHSRHATGIAVNVGRIMDDQLDQLLSEATATVDPDALDRIGQDITKLFAENVYNIWLSANLWSIPHQPDVHGVGDVTLASGNRARPSLLGATWLAEAWTE